MNINFFTPVNFDDYQADTHLEKVGNFVGSKLDELFYLGGKKFTVLTKLANRRFEGHIEQRYSLPKFLLIAAIKIACWALPIIAAFSLSQTAGLATLGIGVALFGAKCTYRFLHTFVQTELTQNEEIGAAFRTYGRAAFRNPSVMLNFVKMIIEIDQEKKHTKEVFNLYQFHANRGHPESLYWLALCYLEGNGCHSDQEKALQLLQESADKHCELATRKLEELQKQKETKTPLLRQDSFIKSLNPQQFNDLKDALSGSVRSRPVKQLTPEQLKVREAIEAAYEETGTQAIASAAWMHRLVKKIRSIDKEGEYNKDIFNLYQLHADKKDSQAMFLLAGCYEQGTGCDKDEQKAIEWYQAAAARKNVRARRRLEELGVACQTPAAQKERAVSAEDTQTMIRRK